MSEVQSLARGLIILEHLSEAPAGLSVTELAARLEVDKATASRLLATLAGHSFVEKDEASRRYLLGPQLIAFSRKAVGRISLVDAARPFLVELMQQTGECAHLGIHALGKVLYIDQVESPATLRVNAQVGTLNPLHCTALGKVLLAHHAAGVPPALEAYTSQTITRPAALQTHLEGVRQAGYAVDDEEFDPGVRCVAAPVFNRTGKVTAALGISGPSSRVTPEKLPALAKFVAACADQVSKKTSFLE